MSDLRVALEPFAKIVTPASYHDDTPVWGYNGVMITHGDLRRARAALAAPQGEPSEAAIDADVGSPICDVCAETDMHDCSPEICRACARIRLRAAYAVDFGPPTPMNGGDT